MKVLAVLVVAVMTTGCMTNATYEQRMALTSQAVNDCMSIVSAGQAQSNAIPLTEDARDYALIVMANALAKANQRDPYSTCNEVALASINSDSRVRSALVNGGVSVLSLGVGALAISSAISDIADLGAAKGNSTYSNSRVLDASDGGAIKHSSASGETFNLGNVEAVDGSLGQGGISPRQAIVNESDSVQSPSQSGENAPNDINPGDDAATPVE